jgi:tetratricopeptide (TPR) repeat protein
LLALGGVAAAVSSRRPDWRSGLAGLALVWFAFLAVTAGTFARYWAREETLWNGVISHSPDHFRGYQGLAKARVAAGDYPGARQALESAIAKGLGRYAEVYFDLGRVYLLEARHREAVSCLRRAADIWRREGKTARSLAYVRTLELLLDHYEKTGQAEEARRMTAWLDDSRRTP